MKLLLTPKVARQRKNEEAEIEIPDFFFESKDQFCQPQKKSGIWAYIAFLCLPT
jgi:hypothetical protein